MRGYASDPKVAILPGSYSNLYMLSILFGHRSGSLQQSPWPETSGKVIMKQEQIYSEPGAESSYSYPLLMF